MLSEGSCDTEAWSNGFRSFAITGINYILNKFKYSYFKLKQSTTIPILLCFDQINITFVSVTPPDTGPHQLTEQVANPGLRRGRRAL